MNLCDQATKRKHIKLQVEEKWKTITRQQEQLNSLLNPEMCWAAIRIQLGARMPKAIEGRPKGEAGWRRSLQKLFPSIRSTHLCPFNPLFIYSKQSEVLNTVRLLFWGHHLRWVRHRGSNRCHYPLNWLGHASTFPSCLTSPYYNSLSSHYCHVVHVLCTYIIARHKNIECIECAQSQVVETNADLFRRNQLCLHRRFGRLSLIAFLCVYSLSWRKWTLCSTSDGRISFVTSLLTGVGTIHWREEGRVEDVRSVGICSTTVKRNTVKRNTVQILCNVGDKTFDGRFISINISLCNKLHLTVHCVSCYLLHILLKTTFSFRNYPFHFNWMGAQRKALKRIKIGIAGQKQQDGLQIKIVDGTRD